MSYWLSPSALNLYTECAKCFWYDRNLKLKRPDTIFPSLPGGIDRVVKAYFDEFRRLGSMPPELKSLADEGYTFFPDTKLLEKWRNPRQGISWFDADGNKFFGALDDLLTRENKVAVFDVKTKGSKPKPDDGRYYELQMSCYDYLLGRNGYEVEDEAVLIYYYPEKIDPDLKRMIYGTDIVRLKLNPEKAYDTYRSAIQTLSQKEPPSPADDCGHCNWLEARSTSKP